MILGRAGVLVRGSRSRTARLALGLCALVAVVYLPALRNGFVSWDDYKFVVENEAVTSAGGLCRIWSTAEMPPLFPNYPLVFTSFWLEHRLWGLQPAGYHATNVALHALNAVLVLLLMRAVGATVWVAGLTAALFAVHPMQVESVAWVAERKNVLSGLFYLLSFLLYLRHRSSGRWRWYGLSLLAFTCALLSKTATVMLPASLLLLERLSDGHWTRAAIARTVPMWILGIAAGALTLVVERASPTEAPPLLARPLVAAAALCFYMAKLIAPVGLLPIYPPWAVSAADPRWWLPAVGVAVAACMLLKWPPHWQVRWGLGHFACTLLPVLNLIPFGFSGYSYVADRFVYLACIGAFASAALALERLRRWRTARGFLSIAACAAVAVCGVLAWQQTERWHNSETLWTYVLAGNPSSYAAHASLGKVLLDGGRLDEAAAHLRTALVLQPNSWLAHLNLAMVLYRQRDFIGAEDHSRQVAAMAPDVADGHSNLGMALEVQGKLTAAEQAYREALRLAPSSAETRYNLANVLLAQGRAGEAVGELERCVTLKPEFVRARNNLAVALRRVGRRSEAVAQLEQAVRLDPSYATAHYNLGDMLLEIGRRDEAATHLRRVIELEPAFPGAREKLAGALGGSAQD
jgi:tetratricopeptide (TPR) repeat protein